MPTWKVYPDPSPIDLVVVPAIDGNFSPSSGAMIPFEREFQSLHSLQNYFLLNELLAADWPMPLLDSDLLRKARASWLHRFCLRPFFFIRAPTPQVLLDEVEKLL